MIGVRFEKGGLEYQVVREAKLSKTEFATGKKLPEEDGYYCKTKIGGEECFVWIEKEYIIKHGGHA